MGGSAVNHEINKPHSGLHHAAVDIELVHFLNFNCFAFLDVNFKDPPVGTNLFGESASFVVRSGFLDAAAELRTLSV